MASVQHELWTVTSGQHSAAAPYIRAHQMTRGKFFSSSVSIEFAYFCELCFDLVQKQKNKRWLGSVQHFELTKMGQTKAKAVKYGRIIMHCTAHTLNWAMAFEELCNYHFLWKLEHAMMCRLDNRKEFQCLRCLKLKRKPQQ